MNADELQEVLSSMPVPQQSGEKGYASTTVTKLTKGEPPELLKAEKEQLPMLKGDPATFSRVTVGKSVKVNLGGFESVEVRVDVQVPTDTTIGVRKMYEWATNIVNLYIGEEVQRVKKWK